MPIKVEGVDYTPDGVMALREDIIQYRDQSMKQWPEAIQFTVTMTHVIALLSYLAELEGTLQEYGQARDIETAKENMRAAAEPWRAKDLGHDAYGRGEDNEE